MTVRLPSVTGLQCMIHALIFEKKKELKEYCFLKNSLCDPVYSLCTEFTKNSIGLQHLTHVTSMLDFDIVHFVWCEKKVRHGAPDRQTETKRL